MEFINLDRSFATVSTDKEANFLADQLWGRRFAGWLSWADLLKRKRVVLLAEAASGKTEEFRHTAAALQARGDRAFYCPIERLAERSILHALDPAQAAAASDWKDGNDIGWFFLDSLDEARLNRKSFEGALSQLAHDLGHGLSHAHILVSCRISDWKGHGDREALRRLLPLPAVTAPRPEPQDPDAALLDPIFGNQEDDSQNVDNEVSGDDKEETSDPLIVQLVPLSSEQRRLLATAA